MEQGVETRLEDAFRTFGELSERLEASYLALQERVAELTSELTATQLRRDAERRERERLEARLAELMVLLPAGVVVVGPAGEIREINPMAAEQLGGARVGDAWCERAPAAVAEVPPGSGECTLASGRTLAVSKRSLGCGERLLVLNDVTETRRLQAALDRQSRVAAVAELAAGLAHQLRTPLSTAMLHLHRIRRAGEAQGVELAERVDALGEQLWRIEATVEQSLSFARGTAPGDELVDLAQLLGDIRRGTEPQIAGRAYLVLRQDVSGVAVRVNRATLVSALCDLVLNAANSAADTARPVRIELSARRCGADVEIVVADDGAGVAEELREKIFEPFFTTREGGTGLGLAIVRASVNGHGGEIRCVASELGGAGFVVRLPLAAQARPAASAAPEVCA
ncbi:MAG: ATP-binding protein [Pseudomonadales bacterium]|nr:ATP-binding protein [Pseudomonadales bacterium]